MRKKEMFEFTREKKREKKKCIIGDERMNDG